MRRANLLICAVVFSELWGDTNKHGNSSSLFSMEWMSEKATWELQRITHYAHSALGHRFQCLWLLLLMVLRP